MGKAVLGFSKQYPNPSPAFATAIGRLQDLLARARQLAELQMDGRSEVRAATARKRELRRIMLKGHLDHLASVAQLAAAEEPELIQKFVFPSDATTYLSFQTAARGLAAEAESRKELLIKHGLSEEVLSDLKVVLDQFETVVEQSSAGKLTHVAATAQLLAVADEIVQVVNVLNGLVRLRFATQPDILAAWESASNVVGPPRPESKPDSGDTPPSGSTTPPSGPPPSGNVSPAA
jgi:hypothetical protein